MSDFNSVPVLQPTCKPLYCMYLNENVIIICMSRFKLIVSISIQSSDEEIEEFAVEIHKKTGSGLGITIAGLAMTDTGGNVQHVNVHIHTHVHNMYIVVMYGVLPSGNRECTYMLYSVFGRYVIYMLVQGLA